MKKIVFSLLAMGMVVFGFGQTTYYSCANPSGTNASADPAGANPCSVASTTWNTSTAPLNTLIVRTGTTLSINATFTFNGNVTIENGGFISITGNNRLISVNGTLTIHGTLNYTGNNSTLTVNNGGNVIVSSTGVITNTGNINNVITVASGGTLVNNGSITASGNITLDGTVSGSGTINSGVGTVTIEGDFTYINNNTISTASLSGTGNIRIRRTFNTATTGWVRIGFPVLSGTCGDLTATGFNLNLANSAASTLRVWNASTSQWNFASASTPLNGNAFLLFTGNSATPDRSITTNFVAVNQLNNTSQSQAITYHDGTGGGFVDGTIDGWNHLYNPFQAFMDWNLVTGAMTTNGNFASTAVYVWDGSGYVSWNTSGSTNARWIAPHQTFFVRTIPSASGSFTFTNAMRTTTPGTPVSTFKTTGYNVLLSLVGENKVVQTEIVQNADATPAFDGDFDAFYLTGLAERPVFYTTDASNTKYFLNQSNNHLNQAINLAFSYHQNGKSFVISLDEDLAAMLPTVILEDTHLATLTDLKTTDYTFVSTNTADVNRFKIHLSMATVGVEENLPAGLAAVWFLNNELQVKNINSESIAEIFVVNMAGQVVAQGNAQAPIYIHQNGVYIVRINTKDGHSHNVKVVKM